VSREIEVGRFSVKTDKGKKYTIIQYQEYIQAPTYDNPNAEIQGLKRLVTTTGLSVNYIDSDTYKIVETNEVVHRV